MTVETKRRRIGQRYVRTPAGSDHFNLPIGAPIVGKPNIDLPSRPRDVSEVISSAMAPPAKRRTSTKKPEGLVRADQEYTGWWTWKYKGKKYFVGKDAEYGEGYVATTADDMIVAQGKTAAEAKRGLEAHLGITKAPTIKVPAHLREPRNAKELEDFAKLHGKRVPPGWDDIRITMTEGPHVIATGITPTGDLGRIYSVKHDQQQAAKKWARMKRLHKAMPKLDAALKRDAMKDDTAAAVLLMRKTSIRPGSKSKGQRGSVQTYGATSLQGRHVTFNKDSITLNFIGKKGVAQKYLIRDPEIVAVFRARREQMKANPHDYIFDTTEAKANAYIKAALEDNFSNKDLRTYLANVLAADITRGWKRNPPKTKTEFKKMRTAMATAVAEQLGNAHTMALNSYIDPATWIGFAEPEWLEKKWQ